MNEMLRRQQQLQTSLLELDVLGTTRLRAQSPFAQPEDFAGEERATRATSAMVVVESDMHLPFSSRTSESAGDDLLSPEILIQGSVCAALPLFVSSTGLCLVECRGGEKMAFTCGAYTLPMMTLNARWSRCIAGVTGRNTHSM
uniref:Uncharacterized protein n=1 Tax=Mycena chlorophos TaxID=658473 RepID=A0ABQ0LGH7_MYCCL|nr:predicted protein [Mycena chlorophos]